MSAPSNTEHVEVPRPPESSGSYVPPSSVDKGWKRSVKLDRARFLKLTEQYFSGGKKEVDPVLLWSLLGTHDISPSLEAWLHQVRET